jgi:simple sugar transport system ATP-binding protein
MAMSELLIKVENVSKTFAGVKALNHIQLSIHSGEIRALMGENGCGKSTLIKMISGALTPDEGHITVNGRIYKKLRPIDAIKEGIQVIYQDFSLFPNLTVAENIALNSQLSENKKFMNWVKVRKIAQSALDQIHTSINLNSLVESLTVAEKQLVAISRALVQNAKLIIMDEPTTALTEREVRALFKIIKQLQAKGIAILFVSHKLNEVFEISEHITVVRSGRNVADGPVGSFNRANLVEAMTGREVIEQPATYQSYDKSISLLKLDSLSRAGSFENISMEVYPGEIVGITGLLGSGRTELALALFGMKPADKGVITLDGQPVRIRSIQDAIRLGIAYVPEDRLTEGLFLTQSIGKNIVASSVRKLETIVKVLDKGKIKNQIKQWVKSLNIATPSADLPVNSLSGGNQQRVVIAKWLARNPRILILNGPTVGVDVGSKSDIHAIIKSLSAQGMGVIMISDELPELMQNCNRILLMRRGLLAGEFMAGQISENDLAAQLNGTIEGEVL